MHTRSIQSCRTFNCKAVYVSACQFIWLPISVASACFCACTGMYSNAYTVCQLLASICASVCQWAGARLFSLVSPICLLSCVNCVRPYLAVCFCLWWICASASYVPVCVCLPVLVCVFLCTSVHICVCLCLCVCLCNHLFVRVCISLSVYICLCTAVSVSAYLSFDFVGKIEQLVLLV